MRREIASFAAAFILSTGTPARAQEMDQPVAAQQELTSSRSDVEQVHNIIISNELSNWDEPRITLLDQLLTRLPKSFTEPIDGKNAHFILNPTAATNYGQCVCGPIFGDADKDAVVLTAPAFNPENEVRAFRLLTHELIHRKMPTEVLTENPSLRRPGSYTSPWYESLDEIFGKQFAEVRSDLLPIVIDQRQLLQTIEDREEKETRIRIIDRVSYGIGLSVFGGLPRGYYDRPIEFIPAVLGEAYIGGKEYFYNNLGIFFSDEQVEQLYSFTQSNIFDEWEYEDYLPFSPATAEVVVWESRLALPPLSVATPATDAFLPFRSEANRLRNSS